MLTPSSPTPQRGTPSKTLRTMSADNLQQRYVELRVTLTKNNFLPPHLRTPAARESQKQERIAISEQQRLLRIARLRGLPLQEPTGDEICRRLGLVAETKRSPAQIEKGDRVHSKFYNKDGAVTSVKDNGRAGVGYWIAFDDGDVRVCDKIDLTRIETPTEPPQ